MSTLTPLKASIGKKMSQYSLKITHCKNHSLFCAQKGKMYPSYFLRNMLTTQPSLSRKPHCFTGLRFVLHSSVRLIPILFPQLVHSTKRMRIIPKGQRWVESHFPDLTTCSSLTYQTWLQVTENLSALKRFLSSVSAPAPPHLSHLQCLAAWGLK